MVAPQIVWVTPPEVLAGNTKAWGEKLLQAMLELGDYFAGIIQSWMQQNAPWSDRTSNARQGLVAIADKAAASFTITMMHTVEYGVYLELGTSRMGALPVIGPALEAHIGQVFAALQALVG